MMVDRDGNSSEHLFNIPQGNIDNLIVEPIDNDPHEPEKFLGISVTCTTEKSLTIFRMKDIVQQRWLMACMGATGRGIFSSVLGVQERELEEQWTGMWDITHDVNPLQSPGDLYTTPSQATPQESTEREISQCTERNLSLYPKVPSYQTAEDKTLKILLEGVMVANRQQHDSFLPPIGPPVYVLISVGFGLEVGLETGLQELWDPVTKSCIFIDHKTQQTIYQDPRPLKQAPKEINCRNIIYGPDKLISKIPRGDENSSTVQYHENKAVRKREKWGACIVAKGIDGKSGASGVGGMAGADGEKGEKGSNGSSGSGGGSGGEGGEGRTGHPGTGGAPGLQGTNGSDLSLYLSGNSEVLKIAGSLEDYVDLGGQNSECVLCVDCTGGHGGHGGTGGPGGQGGEGGKGGKGGSGGSSSSGSGGAGGDSGMGGQGGAGGAGGYGGDGANSGNGGHCIIHTSDPKLLHLVEILVSTGEPGKGGQLGSGGIGGMGGNRGKGGSGGSCGSNSQGQSRGSDGPKGASGIDGPPGRNGQHGSPGCDGMRGRDGGLSFVLLSPDGQNTVEQSGYRFHVKIDGNSLKIRACVDDGIYEPNEQITVHRFNLQNIGNMTLPEGAIVSMESTPTIKFNPTKQTLPVLAPQQSLEITQEYMGRIYDVPPPNTQGAYKGEAFFETRVDLLGRPFESAKTKHRLIVQYPIKLDEISIPENLGRGEQCSVYITLTNISPLAYGNFPESAGHVALRIHFDRRLFPFSNATDESSKPFTIIYDQVHWIVSMLT